MKVRLKILQFVAGALITTIAGAQTKVAQYSCGKPGTKEYENFAFWIKDKKRTTIDYAYGEDRKEVKLNYLGKDVIKGDSCFKVQFHNNFQLYIIPKGDKLTVTDSTGKYLKTFTWEYEGPVDGRGTFCSICAEGPSDAIQLIHRYYMK